MYYTLEKLQKEHPIGSIYQVYWNNIYEWCPSKADAELFKQKHPHIRNLRQVGGIILCEKTQKHS